MRLAARALSKQYCLSEQRERVVLRAQAEKQPPQNSLQPFRQPADLVTFFVSRQRK
jgi:hypothetical protein